MATSRADADAIVETYLAGVDAAAMPVARALDGVIRATHADFDVAIKYGILMYAVEGDWRHWVTAIDARPKRVSLRFLYGVKLSDPLHVLRAGTSVLMTWDFAPGTPVDGEAVGRYVAEAVAGYPEYRANAAAILADARAATAPRGQRRP